MLLGNQEMSEEMRNQSQKYIGGLLLSLKGKQRHTPNLVTYKGIIILYNSRIQSIFYGSSLFYSKLELQLKREKAI